MVPPSLTSQEYLPRPAVFTAVCYLQMPGPSACNYKGCSAHRLLEMLYQLYCKIADWATVAGAIKLSTAASTHLGLCEKPVALGFALRLCAFFSPGGLRLACWGAVKSLSSSMARMLS